MHFKENALFLHTTGIPDLTPTPITVMKPMVIQNRKMQSTALTSIKEDTVFHNKWNVKQMPVQDTR